MSIGKTSELSSVSSSQIVDGAVTSAKIAAGAVGSSALASGSVVAASIAAGAVGSAALADNAVVSSKINSGSATSGQILQANGSGGVTFATPAAGGGLTLISTATPSAATTISFTSIPNTYKNLMVVWSLRQSVNDQSFFIRFNNDTGNNYYGALGYIRSNQSSLADTLSNDRVGSTYDINWNPVGMASTGATDYNLHSNGVMAIYRYTDTTQATWSYNSKSYTSAANQSGYASRDAIGIYRTSGTAIDRIDFVRTSTQTVTGTVYLYGVS